MDMDTPQLSPRVLDEWTFVDDAAEFIPVAPETEPSAADEDVTPTPITTPVDTTLPSGGNDSIPEGFLPVRVRLGEHIIPAYFKATQNVEDFTAKFFADARAEGKRVRLIYMGMLLIHDRTMGEYGIEENGVIHAVVNESPPVPHPEAAQQVELKGLATPVNTLLASTGLVLYGLWTLLYHFPHMFSWKAIMLLAVLSGVHISATVSRLSG